MNFVESAYDWARSRGYSDRQVADKYFQLLERIQSADKAGDWRSLEVCSQMSLMCIPILVRHCKEKYGAFDIIEIPALDHSFMFSIARGTKGQMANLMELLRLLPELRPFAEKYENLLELAKVSAYLRANDGTLQADLKRLFPTIEPYWLARTAIYMAMAGIIERQQAGRTFRLALCGRKAESEETDAPGD